MKIEKVLVRKTLKCGSNVYVEGEYPRQGKQLSSDLVAEALSGSGVVEILESSSEPPPIIKTPTGGTTTSEVGTYSGGIIDPEKVKNTPPPKPSKKKVSKPKLKLRSKKK